MKWLIASDIHGSAQWCRRLLEAWDNEQADRLLLLGDVVIAHKSDGACVPADQIQDALDGGGLASAVFSDEAHDGPAGELQIDVVQGKVAVGLAKAGYFNTICHNHSP